MLPKHSVRRASLCCFWPVLLAACGEPASDSVASAPERPEALPVPSAPVAPQTSAEALERALPLHGACVQSSRIDVIENPIVDVELSGRVLAMGSGVPEPFSEEGCPFGGTQTLPLGDGFQSSGDAPALAPISWLRIGSDDGEEAARSAPGGSSTRA
jgi:hypothetical protein